MYVAAAAFAGDQIVFEIRIAVYRGERRERSAAQIRVQHHPGSIDDRTQRRSAKPAQSIFNDLAKGTGRNTRLPHFGKHSAYFGNDNLSRKSLKALQLAKDLVD
jgi:hypothetical protein